MVAQLDTQRCFKILELNPRATVEDAKKAYMDLVSIWHPDRVPSNNPRLQKKATERLKEINAAYDMLLPYLYANQGEGRRPDISKSPRPEHETATYPEAETKADIQPAVRTKTGAKIIIALFLFVISISVGFIYSYWETDIKIKHDPKVAPGLQQMNKGKRADQIENIPTKTGKDTRKQPNVISDRQENNTKGNYSDTLGMQYEKETNNIEKIISEAKNYLKSREYTKSKSSYESALKMISDSPFKKDSLFRARKRKVEDALLNKDIVYGSQGFIKHENKWIAPTDYQKHFVKYKGSVRLYKELNNIITQITDPHIRVYLIEKYSGQNIHRNDVECYKITLNKKSKSSSHFRVFYKWEIWTFKTIEKGELSLDIVYNSETDRWQVGKIYEKKSG